MPHIPSTITRYLPVSKNREEKKSINLLPEDPYNLSSHSREENRQIKNSQVTTKSNQDEK